MTKLHELAAGGDLSRVASAASFFVSRVDTAADRQQPNLPHAEWERPEASPPAEYEPGSWGPVEADELLARDGRTWLLGRGQHVEERGE